MPTEIPRTGEDLLAAPMLPPKALSFYHNNYTVFVELQPADPDSGTGLCKRPIAHMCRTHRPADEWQCQRSDPLEDIGCPLARLQPACIQPSTL